MKLKAIVLLAMAILMLFSGLANSTQRMVLAELFTNTS
jgi:hypothetical protein